MKITKIREVKTPTRGTECSAGLDFYVPAGIRLCMLPGDDVLIPSGIKVEVPEKAKKIIREYKAKGGGKPIGSVFESDETIQLIPCQIR